MIKEGKLELKKVGTHFNPSDVLTKYVPASALGQHLPRLNIFKPETPRPGWEDPVGKDQRFGDSIAIASSIKRLCQAKHVTQHVIA